ncbi:MAG TPA: hypothetical protein VGE07_12505 [Herpetosiphonaceae bacterium]
MWSLLAWVAFGLMVWYGWSGFALLRAATKNRLDMLWLVGAWQVVSAIGALLVWRNALAGSLSFFGVVGLILAGVNPVLWALGNVRGRLLGHGVRIGNLLTLKDR